MAAHTSEVTNGFPETVPLARENPGGPLSVASEAFAWLEADLGSRPLCPGTKAQFRDLQGTPAGHNTQDRPLGRQDGSRLRFRIPGVKSAPEEAGRLSPHPGMRSRLRVTAADQAVDLLAGERPVDLGLILSHEPLETGPRFRLRPEPRFAARTDRLIIVDHCPGSGGGLERALKQTVGKPATVFASVEAAQEAMSRDRNTPPGSAALARIESFLRPVAGGFVFPRDPDFGNPVPLDAGDGWAPEIVVEDYWAELARVRVPTVIIRGTQSDRYKPDAIARVAKEFPNILMIDVNSGHDVPGGARDELIDLKRVRSARQVRAVLLE